MGKRVPSFETVKGWLVDWAIEHQAQFHYSEDSIEFLRNCRDDQPGRAFVRNTYHALIRVGAKGALVDWYRGATDFALSKAMG